ncbi:MAG: hypothetical protein KBD83_02480 [Gammaproteobacteria bacterium]|nr:hypothetical protein [Gammaproteobacteria bacterium]
MPGLIKLYTDAQKRFISQIYNNRNASWRKKFNSMRVALHQCLKELNLESAVQQYYKLYTVMQEYPPENDIAIAGAITELVVESGWLLCNRDIDKNSSIMLQSVLSCISFAVMNYNCINVVCAEHLLERGLLSESEAYYHAAYEMLIAFLEKLPVLKIEHTIDISSLGNEVRTLILKKAFLSMRQNKSDELTYLLSQYEMVSSQNLSDESEQVGLERLREYEILHDWLKKQREIRAIETEVKRRKKKIRSLPSVDSIDQIFDIPLLTELNTSLELQKEREDSQKILDEINLRQKRVLQKISSLNEVNDLIFESVVSEILAQEILNIVLPEQEVHQEILINDICAVLLESIVSEILQQDLFYVANEVDRSHEISHFISENSTIKGTSTEDISEISLNLTDEFQGYLVSIPHFLDKKPFCSQDKYFEFIEFFSTILERNNCDAFLFGSANYKKNPNDLDILLSSNDMRTVNSLIGEIILYHDGIILANYEKINRRVVKMKFYGILIDFILSSETILEHSKRLDFTIGALYFDLRRKIMFCPNDSSFQHIQFQMHVKYLNMILALFFVLCALWRLKISLYQQVLILQ